MSQLVIDVRQALKRTNLEKLTEESFQTYEGITCTYQEVKDYLEQRGLSIDNVYEANTGLYTFWYIDDCVFISLFTLGLEELEILQLDKRVKIQKETLNRYWKEGEYESFFALVETQFSFDLFLQLYQDIPQDQRYEVFIDLYTRNDYGFQELDQTIVREILEPKKGTTPISLLESDAQGYITLYRGNQSKSADPKTAYSWTVDFEVAKFFATRFNSVPSSIYTAKVHHSNIVDLLTRRNESEVIVLPEDLKDLKSMGYLNLDHDFIDNLHDSGCMEDYQHYANQVIDEWFHNPSGVHGVKHIKRVLMNTLIMSYTDNLPSTDKRLLAYAAIFHDIGRTNDDYDLYHGKQSVDKMKKYNLLPSELNKEERQILEFLMEYHAKPDDSGIRRLKRTGIKDKERALDLFKRFKDCDGLDRVRLGDLNQKYLRTETGKKMLLLAHQLVRIKEL